MINANAFWLPCIVFLTILTGLVFIRAIRGPRIADRIMAVNMIGTLAIAIILLLSVYLDEPAIIDIALIYALASFVAVIVLSKIYIGIYREKSRKAALKAKEKAVRKADVKGGP